MKIITTACLSVLIMDKKLTIFQWISIIFLTIGIALVQLSQTKTDATGSVAEIAADTAIIGLLCVFLGSCTSGFAGVYLEKVLKNSQTSIWMRNIQMSIIGVALSSFVAYQYDREVIIRDGFFKGIAHW